MISAISSKLKEENLKLDPFAKLDPRWFEIFMNYFIETEILHDDLLFFVPIDQSTRKLIIKRKQKQHQLPDLEDLINWQETLLINMVMQNEFHLIITVRNKKEQRFRLERTVYSAPKRHEDDYRSYPLVYFYSDEETMVEMQSVDYLTIELFLETKCLFQGAVGFDALKAVNKEQVLMKGPDKGHAEITLKTNSSRTFLFKTEPSKLFCSLNFIRINLHTLIKDLT